MGIILWVFSVGCGVLKTMFYQLLIMTTYKFPKSKEHNYGNDQTFLKMADSAFGE